MKMQHWNISSLHAQTHTVGLNYYNTSCNFRQQTLAVLVTSCYTSNANSLLKMQTDKNNSNTIYHTQQSALEKQPQTDIVNTNTNLYCCNYMLTANDVNPYIYSEVQKIAQSLMHHKWWCIKPCAIFSGALCMYILSVKLYSINWTGFKSVLEQMSPKTESNFT